MRVKRGLEPSSERTTAPRSLLKMLTNPPPQKTNSAGAEKVLIQTFIRE